MIRKKFKFLNQNIKKPFCKLKPLYKKYSRLKQNIHSRLKIYSFKKKKWHQLLMSLNNRKTVKRTYKYNYLGYQKLQFFRIKLKTKFRFALMLKQRLNLFYGSLLKRYLKRNAKKSRKNFQISRSLFKNTNFIQSIKFVELLEKRIDVILFRSNFVGSVKKARQSIFHGHVYLNNKKIKNCSFLVKKGDLIKLIKNQLYIDLIKKEKKKKIFFFLPPKYIHVNYKLFQVFLINNIEVSKLTNLYPFDLNINTIVKKLIL